MVRPELDPNGSKVDITSLSHVGCRTGLESPAPLKKGCGDVLNPPVRSAWGAGIWRGRVPPIGKANPGNLETIKDGNQRKPAGREGKPAVLCRGNIISA